MIGAARVEQSIYLTYGSASQNPRVPLRQTTRGTPDSFRTFYRTYGRDGTAERMRDPYESMVSGQGSYSACAIALRILTIDPRGAGAVHRGPFS